LAGEEVCDCRLNWIELTALAEVESGIGIEALSSIFAIEHALQLQQQKI
jgi:hypothetical protein